MVSEVEIPQGSRKPKAIVFEDDAEVANYILIKLSEKGMDVRIVDNMNSFEESIKKESFDVASVDWDIKGVHEGPKALKRLKQFEADAGKVVYSVHTDDWIRQKAKREGADFFVEKNCEGEDHEIYFQAVEEAANLGLLRKIAHFLGRREQAPAVLDENFAKEPRNMAKLYENSRKVALETVITGDDSSELIELLVRQGWWQRFDIQEYANRPWNAKLAQLIACVGEPIEGIAQILNLELDSAACLIRGEYEPAANEEVLKEADELLSILAYVLRLSEYQPDVAPYFWNERDLFKSSLSGPPWDKLGLSNYLKNNQTFGIKEALFWIRSH